MLDNYETQKTLLRKARHPETPETPLTFINPLIFNYYPKEMLDMYNAYLTDKQNLRWQVLDAKYAAALLLNKNGFPTKLKSIFSILQYDQYLANELERNSQQLDKIIAHKMPT